MPYGYFVSLLIAALLIGVALRPLRRPRRLGIAAYMVGLPAQEWPVLFGVLVTLSTVQAIVADGLLATPVGWVALSVAVLLLAGVAVLIARAGMGRRAVADALGIDLPAHRWARVLWPVPLRPRSIVRTPNLAYGHDHPRQRLDVYRRRDAVGPAPTLLYLHGGGYFFGSKHWECRSLWYRLAARGWTVVSADYGLRPKVTFPGHLIDAERALAWCRLHGPDHGVDPARIAMGGSSAGAHLAVLTALSGDDPALRPGFEDADPGVQAVVGLYGYYGAYYDYPPGRLPLSDPLALPADDLPPTLLVHGTYDTYTPVESERALVQHLRADSPSPVMTVELPGAQHGFDILASDRFEAVETAIERFLVAELEPQRAG